MANNSNFFESPQAAAVYKHRLIRTYIPAWVGKVGSTSTGKRVVVYDAYSGPGRYDNAEPGSPEILVDTAVAMANLRAVRTIFSEKNTSYCDRLEVMLAGKGIDASTYEVRKGPVEDHVDQVLSEASNLPLFVFLDPYGLSIDFGRIAHVLQSRDKSGTSRYQQPKTELLLNFSYEAVRRIAGALRSERDYAAKAKQIQALDTALGGDWWQTIALEEPDGWVEQVLNGFADRVAKAAHCGYVTANVADSLTAQPVYELILFTRHNDGLWKMVEAMSMARKEWRQWLVDQRQEAGGGQAELRGLDWDDDETGWVDEIAKNVEHLLSETSSFEVEKKLSETLGRTLGLARETHIRKALRGLYSRSIISAAPVGNLQHFHIARA